MFSGASPLKPSEVQAVSTIAFLIATQSEGREPLPLCSRTIENLAV